MIRKSFFAGLVAAASMYGSTFGEQADHQAEWSVWLGDANANYATTRKAILKAADVVYLKRGDTAWLSLDPRGAGHLSVKEPSDGLFNVAYDGETAVLTRDGLTLDLAAFLKDAARYPITDRIDLGGGETVIGPDERGMRLIVFDQNREAARTFNGLNGLIMIPLTVLTRLSALLKK